MLKNLWINSCYRFVSIFLTLLLLMGSGIAQAANTIELSFGLYTSDKPTTLVKKFRPLLNALEKAMQKQTGQDVSIKLNIARSYEEGIQALVEGKVDFARFGPASYIQAYQQNSAIKLIVMETKKGKKHFNGVICTHQNSAINTIADLKGKRFAFGNKRSTIGRYLSQQYLLQHGIRARDLSMYEYLGRHDKVGYAIAQGQFDAGALKESTFKKLLKKSQPLKKIASFKNVTKPWVARKGLNPKTYLALQKALLNMKGHPSLKAIKKDGFAISRHSDYQSIQQAIRNNPPFFK